MLDPQLHLNSSTQASMIAALATHSLARLMSNSVRHSGCSRLFAASEVSRIVYIDHGKCPQIIRLSPCRGNFADERRRGILTNGRWRCLLASLTPTFQDVIEITRRPVCISSGSMPCVFCKTQPKIARVDLSRWARCIPTYSSPSPQACRATNTAARYSNKERGNRYDISITSSNKVEKSSVQGNFTTVILNPEIERTDQSRANPPPLLGSTLKEPD